jgi:outer membrane protein assembly factor BamB
MKTTLALVLAAGVACGADWPQWRGPQFNGVAPDANPPLKWDEQTNVRWKTPLPGRGNSSPVVLGDVVYVTTAVREGTNCQFTVLAVGRQDGRILWQKVVCEEPPPAPTHAEASWASGSPIADGELVYAHFGSQGLYCLDRQGNVKWSKRVGVMKTRNNFGEGTTPVVYGDTLVLTWDQEGPGFIIALDKKTGVEKWRAERSEPTAWATPLVVEHAGKRQVIASATNRIRSYDFASGKLLWECGGMTVNVIPTPVSLGDLVIALSGFRGAAAVAVKLPQAHGDITDKAEALAWRYAADTPYVPSPLLVGDRLYFLKVNGGRLTCLDGGTGRAHYTGQLLDGSKKIYASPVSANGRVYITGTEGLTHVVKEGPIFELLGVNQLDDKFMASAAVAGQDFILRGTKHLYCLGEKSR